MKKNITRKITLAGILLGVVIVMQLLKNISAFISGPVINAVLVIATLELGIWWGVGFCIGVPLLSLLISPASPMTQMAFLTYGVVTIVVIIGNLIFCLAAYFGKKTNKLYWFIVLLVAGALAKWGFMWGSASWIIKPLFEVELGKLVAAVDKVFSLLQLYSGLLSIILIVPLSKLIDKLITTRK